MSAKTSKANGNPNGQPAAAVTVPLNHAEKPEKIFWFELQTVATENVVLPHDFEPCAVS